MGAGTRCEHGVGRIRAEHGDAFFGEQLHRRTDNAALLVTHCTILAGMRIETGEGEARIGDAEITVQSGGRDAGGLDDDLAGERGDGVAQRDVDGYRHNA